MLLTQLKTSLGDLRIADLELWITAARFQSLSKAAAFRHISQSAASSAIVRVEKAFGKPLCRHERRQFKLTEEGRQFLPRAEAWLKNLRETVVATEPATIRLATTHAIARVALPAAWQEGEIDLLLMRPDAAYGAVLKGEADVALVLDNSPWEGVIATEVGKGSFRLFCSEALAEICPVLLPEDQMEVLALQQRWEQAYGYALPIKSRIPSWSLIADLCACLGEVGFLPDFLAAQAGLYPVAWQPLPSRYRVLALSRPGDSALQNRLTPLLASWKKVFI